MNNFQGRTIAALAGLGIVASLALTGCSFTGGSSGQPGSTGGSSPESSSSADGGSGGTEAPLEGFEGKPETFPSEVPIISGDVAFGVDLGTGWSVVVKTDDVVAAYQDAEGRLTGAGFTSQLSSTTDEGSFGSFENDKYTVQVTATDSADYGPSVTYVVVLKG